MKELGRREFMELLAARFVQMLFFAQRPVSVGRWSPRIFASERSPWQALRGFNRLKSLARTLFCSEVVSSKSLQRARRDPVGTILAAARPLADIANPFSVRPLNLAAEEKPLFFLSVATLRVG
jgi:hypothetical protein